MPVKIEIVMTDDGQIGFRGPVENKILCYGLLEVARDIISAHGIEKSQVQLVVPQVSLPPLGGL